MAGNGEPLTSPEKIAQLKALVEGGLSVRKAAADLGIKESTAHRIAKRGYTQEGRGRKYRAELLDKVDIGQVAEVATLATCAEAAAWAMTILRLKAAMGDQDSIEAIKRWQLSPLVPTPDEVAKLSAQALRLRTTLLPRGALGEREAHENARRLAQEAEKELAGE